MAPTHHVRQKDRSVPETETKRKANKRKKSLKDKIRGVQRLLHQKNLPATVRITQERMLDMLQENLKDNAKKQKEIKMAKKYKMVKFFEKRKLSRMYKTCLNELTASADEQRKELNSNLELLKHQWNYITYFPKDEKYISLFPPTPCSNAETLQHKDEILEKIKEKVANGELRDASDMILQSPKEKKNKQIKSTIKQAVKLSPDNTKQEEDEDTFKTSRSLVDDFFIDTNPSEDINEGNQACDTVPVTNKSTYSAMGLSADKKSSTRHKVKRLKNQRDIAADKKKKKIKKKSIDESE